MQIQINGRVCLPCFPGELVRGVASGAVQLAWSCSAPPHLVSLVARCLSPDAAQRPNAAHVACRLARIESSVRSKARQHGGVRDRAGTLPRAVSWSRLRGASPRRLDPNELRERVKRRTETWSQMPPLLRTPARVVPQGPERREGHDEAEA